VPYYLYEVKNLVYKPNFIHTTIPVNKEGSLYYPREVTNQIIWGCELKILFAYGLIKDFHVDRKTVFSKCWIGRDYNLAFYNLKSHATGLARMMDKLKLNSWQGKFG